VRAHAERAVQHAAFQGLTRARVNVFDCEGVLNLRRFFHVIGCAPVLQRLDTVEDARLVEMEMTLDEPG
jgi:hypothetical protein